MPEEDKSSKTEKPTERRREEFRKKGQIAISKDLVAAATLMLSIMALAFFGQFMYAATLGFTRSSLGHLNLKDGLKILGTKAFWTYWKVVLPVIAGALLAAIGTTMAQTRGTVAWERLAPDPSRFDIVSRLKQMIMSKESLARLVKELVKVIIIVWIAYSFISGNINKIRYLVFMQPAQGLSVFTNLAVGLVIRLLPAILVIAALDYAWERYLMEEKMMMTKQEVKQEHKEQEGDPHVKGRMKSRMRAMVLNKLIKEVPNSDVVIVNPDHFAVAIKYDALKAPAPYILAKGRGPIALKIRELARKNNVPVMPNPSLARFMYFKVKVGALVPPETYKAVAAILAAVYRLRGGRR